MPYEWVQINVTGSLVPYVGSPPPDTGYLYKDGATIFDPQNPGYPFPFGPTTPFDQWSPQTGHYSSIGVEAGSIGTVYTDAQFSALLASNTIVGGYYANTGYQSFYQIQLSDLGPGPWPYNYYLGDPVSIPVPNPYAGGDTFTYYSHMWAEIYVVGPLFTTDSDSVDFNKLLPDQVTAVNGGADLYNALGGGDTITLPDANPTDTSVTLAGTTTTFDLKHVFNVGDNQPGVTTTVTGANGSYNIALGAGSDTVTIDGTGTTKVTAGSGADTFSISGGGTLVVNGNLTGGSATIGANSTLELNGTDSGVTTFDPLGLHETLRIDGTTMPTGLIKGFSAGDTLDLKDIAFDPKSATVLQTSNNSVSLNNVLHAFANGQDYQLQLDPNQAFSGGFIVSQDGNGGTDITVSLSPVTGNPVVTPSKAYSTAVYPYDAVVSIQAPLGNADTELATGFVIGPHTILTAAHVVLDQLGSVLTNLTIKDDKGNVIGPVLAQNIHPDPSFVPLLGGNPLNTQHDIAVINVAQDLSSYGSFDLIPGYGGGTLNVTGYPKSAVGIQVTDIGSVSLSSISNTFVEGTLTSSEGQSGGPLWTFDAGGAHAVGIVSGSSLGSSYDVQLTPADLSEITSWKNSPILQTTSKAEEGYLSGAAVFADANRNGQLDPGEASTTTDSTGGFSLTGGSGPLIAVGGTDISTGLLFKGQLSAPTGSSVITPLTTLLTSLGSDLSAQQKILAALGLSSTLDLTTFDPIAAAQSGSADGAAAEVAGTKIYDTVEMIGSALAGAGGQFAPSLQAAFAALATALDGAGINLSDQTAVSALITQVAQAQNITLGNGVADGVAAVIAAGNAALDHVLQTDQSGTTLLNDTAAIELVMQGPSSTAIQQAVNDSARLQNVVATFTGTSLTNLISTALTQLGSDTDTGEQSALQLTINSGAATPLGAAIAGNAPFTIAGLELEDSGTVTFTDSNGKTVQVNVNGGQTSYTVNLSSLADGQITSALAVDTDPAGNSFTPVAGNVVSLDTNAAFAPILQVDGGAANVFADATTAKAVPVTLTGLQTGDTGTVTFTDDTGHTVPLSVSASQTSYTVDLSSLADGAITSSLLVIDAASNTGTAIGNPVVLDQDKVAEAPILTIADRSLTVRSGGSIPLGIKVTPLDSDDTVLVMISGVPQGFESITADDGHAPVSHHGANYTFTAADVNAGLTLHSTYRGGGHPVNQLTVTASNTTAGEAVNSATQTITVTDRPVPVPSASIGIFHALSDLIARFAEGHDFHGSVFDAVFDHRDHGVGTKANGVITDIAALMERFMGGPSLSGGTPDLFGSSLAPKEQSALLTVHHG